MTTTTHRLIQATTPTSVVVTITEPELSGSQWVDRYPGSNLITDLDTDFSKKVTAFINALTLAGAIVVVSATYRPPERAYLMRGCWNIGNRRVLPSQVPSMKGVNIKWDHGDLKKSIASAKEMMSGYGITRLRTRPALKSRHTEGKAIDMNISWDGTLNIKDSHGNKIVITTEPRTGMNAKLEEVGKTYGVIKFWKGAKDLPHWSTDGK